jgi:hypothetical protein
VDGLLVPVLSEGGPLRYRTTHDDLMSEAVERAADRIVAAIDAGVYETALPDRDTLASSLGVPPLSIEAALFVLREQGRIILWSGCWSVPGPDDPYVERSGRGWAVYDGGGKHFFVVADRGTLSVRALDQEDESTAWAHDHRASSEDLAAVTEGCVTELLRLAAESVPHRRSSGRQRVKIGRRGPLRVYAQAQSGALRVRRRGDGGHWYGLIAANTGACEIHLTPCDPRGRSVGARGEIGRLLFADADLVKTAEAIDRRNCRAIMSTLMRLGTIYGFRALRQPDRVPQRPLPPAAR